MKIERVTLIISLVMNLLQGMSDVAMQWYDKINQNAVQYDNVRQWNPEGIRDTSSFQIASPPTGHKDGASKR